MTTHISDSEADRLKARVAWLYFIGGMTQQQIAREMGITRLRVNRLIGQVRTEGAISIKLNLPLAENVALEEALKERFGLLDAAVLPTMPDYADIQRTIGEAAGRMLETHLEHFKGIGVGWGRTLSHAGRCIRSEHSDLTHVVSLMGARTRGSGSNTIEVATSIANVLGMECYYLTAPLYCRSAQVLNALLEDDDLALTMERAERVEVALVACGDLSERSSVMQLGIVQEMQAELLDCGAVGDVLGCFLDAEGRIVDHPLNRTRVALSPEALRDKPVSILASGGRNKLQILHASLRGGYFNHLVTDEETARALVSEQDSDNR